MFTCFSLRFSLVVGKSFGLIIQEDNKDLLIYQINSEVSDTLLIADMRLYRRR